MAVSTTQHPAIFARTLRSEKIKTPRKEKEERRREQKQERDSS